MAIPGKRKYAGIIQEIFLKHIKGLSIKAMISSSPVVNLAVRMMVIYLVFQFTGNFSPVYSQGTAEDLPDYAKIFGSDYDYAIKTLEKKIWWAQTLEEHGLDARFALAIVFPELIRYSSILDYIEIKGLEVLYVQYGKDYADFSIGYFQMKPSFAEHIESDILKYSLEKDFPALSALNPSGEDNPETRSERVVRMKDEYHQLLYLEAFIRIMDHLYHDWNGRMPLTMKLQFYSTAYNTGYFKDLEVIREEMKMKRFYCGMDMGVERYSYEEIALRYFLDSK